STLPRARGAGCSAGHETRTVLRRLAVSTLSSTTLFDVDGGEQAGSLDVENAVLRQSQPTYHRIAPDRPMGRRVDAVDGEVGADEDHALGQQHFALETDVTRLRRYPGPEQRAIRLGPGLQLQRIVIGHIENACIVGRCAWEIPGDPPVYGVLCDIEVEERVADGTAVYHGIRIIGCEEGAGST